VDKDGILCYPQPIPEKIFFFKEQSKIKQTPRDQFEDCLSGDDDEDEQLNDGDDDSLHGIENIRSLEVLNTEGLNQHMRLLRWLPNRGKAL